MKSNTLYKYAACIAASLGVLLGAAVADDIPYTEEFFLEHCNLRARGVNDFFIPLIPGAVRTLMGEEEDDEGETVSLAVVIKVMPGSYVVDGVRCAVVREKEWEDEELVEISWNYFAICRTCRNIYYFGEHVNIYEDGEVVSHDGEWLAGVDGAKAGLIMPGCPLVGSRYFQEIAPGVALDRAEHLSNTYSIETPAVVCDGDGLLVAETTPLDPEELSLKVYCRWFGLVKDGAIELVRYRNP